MILLAGGLTGYTTATDAAAAVGPSSSSTTVDDNVITGTDHFAYKGASWTNCGGCNRGAYRNGFHYGYTTGDTAVFSFTGSQVKLYGFREPVGGIASVSVDGGRAVDVNYHATKRVASLLYASPVLVFGRHSISITVTGREAGGSSATINLDRASVSTARPKSTAPNTAAAVKSGKWFSGESDSVTYQNGSFAAWRGRPVEIGGTWGSTDSWGSMENSPSWTVGPGAAWAKAPRMDYAMGAWPENVGSFHNWARAASGAYDAHWIKILKNLKAAWGKRPASNMYIRFAHEMNGNWENYSVPPGQIAHFKAAWARMHKLVRKYFPGSKLVWSVNHNSAWNYSVTALWPGNANVDVVSMDSYNNYGWCSGTATCKAKFNATQSGGPAGLETLRKFAKAHGKPFAVSEWSNAAVDNGGGGGDAPAYFQAFHDWLTAHGGTGPGKVLYEIVFNIRGFPDHYEIFQSGVRSRYQPRGANKYRQLW